MKQFLKRKQLVDSNYEVNFFLGGNENYQTYRVKGKDNKTYLLKLCNSSKLSHHSFNNGRLLEFEILSNLDNPNVIRAIDDGELVVDNQKFHYIIFNFVSGETILNRLKREGVFPIYDSIPIIIEILEGINYLHNLQIPVIHNNINLDSIILDLSENKAKPILSNFDFARYVTSKSNTIDLSDLSPFHIAPEVFNGIYTSQSDIFSIGALLYNMVFGVPPWYIEIPKYQFTPEKFISSILEKRNEDLHFITDEFIDDHLKQTIIKSLSVNVDKRFKTADEFIKALKREVVVESIRIIKTPKVKKNDIKAGGGFSAIAGMQELKDLLFNDVIQALNEPELYKSYGITIPNGMLLYGPPGCGKTFISEKFAEEVGFNFLQLKPSDIKSKYINETEEKISGIFKEAEDNAPTIIFIDEIDAVVPNREGDLHHMNASAVNEFLTQMSNCSERGIFVITASNRPEKIDPAILRTGRIDRIIYLSPPDYEARTSMFKLYLKDRPTDLGMDYKHLAKLTNDYVSSDIKFLVDEASRFALKKRERITMKILIDIISNTKPSVSKSEIEKYIVLKDKFENDKQEPKSNSIGFKR